MKKNAILLVAAALLGPAAAHAGKGYSLSIDVNHAERCSEVRATSRNGEVARSAESVTLGPRELAALEIDDASGAGVVQVRAWDRAEYSIETCKLAVAENRAAAETLLRGVNVTRSAGRITTYGPSSSDGNWQVVFLVRAPQHANLDISTRNGPISVEGIAGSMKVRAVNGPLGLKNCGGRIDAVTTNGPISFSGSGGDVKLVAHNGPVSVDLAGDAWNGPQLDARTVNGPVSLTIPDNYRSGVRLETSGHAPLSCNIAACRNVMTDLTGGARSFQLNGSADTVRVSTQNGPVSVKSGGGGFVAPLRVAATVR